MASQGKKTSVKVWHKGLIAQLEPRLMYDGAAGVVAVEVMDNAHDGDVADTSHDVPDGHVPAAMDQGEVEIPDAGPEIAAVLDALESSPEIRCEIAFVDASVQDAEALITGLDPAMEVYRLDATQNGLSQIAEILAGRQGVDAIHIFSHGGSGEISLGTENITADNAETLADEFATIGQAMDADGDILIYGCNVGQDSEFIEQLADLTGADVAASDDATGAIELGGDWDLETQTENVDTNSVTISDYRNLLMVSTGNSSTDSAPVISLSDSSSAWSSSGAPVVVDSGLTVTDADGGDIDGARVSIENMFQGDTLSFTSSDGITGSFDADTGILSLMGSASAEAYQTVLRSVKFSNSNDNPETTTRNISITLGSALSYGDHYYEYVSDRVIWTEAESAASNRTYYGLEGYLTTVTSAEENAFIATKLEGMGWMGASDAAQEGVWRWVTGPEGEEDNGAGRYFFQQTGSDTSQAIYNYTTPGGGYAINGLYHNWASLEPNDWGSSGEDYAHFYLSRGATWNDYPSSSRVGYVVEYGGMDGDPDLQLTATKSVQVSLGPVNAAPQVVGGPVSRTLAETNTSLETSGTFTVTDEDTSDAVVVTSSLDISGTSDRTDVLAPSDAELLAMFSLTPANILNSTQDSATLTWDFNSGSETFDYLAAGETLVLEYTVQATDNAETPLSDTETVTISISGTNDVPVITLGESDSVASDVTETDAGLISSGTFSLGDLDRTDGVNITESVSAGQFDADGNAMVSDGNEPDNTALLDMFTATPQPIDGTALSGTVTWDFNSNNEAFNYLVQGEKLVLTYTLTATDSQNATDTQDITVTITGTNDVPVITVGQSDSATAELTEAEGMLTSEGTLSIGYFDRTDVVNITEAVSTAQLDANGNAMASDGNEPDNAALLNMFAATPQSIDGTAQAGTLTWEFNATGEAFNYLAQGEQLVLTYTLTTMDAQNVTDTQDVTVTITGANDVPVISVDQGDSDTAELTETDGTLASEGTLSINDLDRTDVVNITKAVSAAQLDANDNAMVSDGNEPDNAALLNMFAATLQPVDGTAQSGSLVWAFNSNGEAFNYLVQGEKLVLTYTLTATDAQDATDTRDITVTITGTNDVPVITVGQSDSATAELTETDGTLTSDGTLSIGYFDRTDVVNITEAVSAAQFDADGNPIVSDGNEPDNIALLNMFAATPQAVDGTAQAGTITWDFNSNDEAFNYLAQGETLVLTYTLTATDTQNIIKTQDVTVTITGTNDNPFILGPDAVSGNEDTSISVTGIQVGDLDSDSITVNIQANDGNLELGSSTGVTVTGSATHSLQLTGNATDLNAALNTLRYQGDLNFNGEDPLTVTVRDESSSPQPYWVDQMGKFYNPSNGHYYEFVSAQGMSWDDAKVAAEARTLYGLNGYLVTVTSQAENDFIQPKLGGDGWMGASDADVEGTWKWVTGPEEGTVFWIGTSGGTSVDGQYQNWAGPEPNDYGAGEDVAHFYKSTGLWNDYPNEISSIQGYVVEYGGENFGGTTPDAAFLNVTVNPVNDNPVITAVEVEGSIIEGSGDLSENGSVTFVDVDLPDRPAATEATKSVTAYKADGATSLPLSDIQKATIENGFSITNVDTNTNNGTVTWAYSIAENQIDFLAEGETIEAVFTLTLDDGNGGSDTQDVTVTITGTNDAPVLTVAEADSAAAELTETDGTLTSGGTLFIGDLDRTDVVDISKAVSTAQLDVDGNVMASDGNEPDNAALLDMFAATPQPIDGTAQAGTITWDFNSNGEAFNYLAQGEQLVLTYTLTATDAQNATDTQDVVVTITGTNDAPVITVAEADSAAAELTETDGTLTSEGTLSIGDLDRTDVVDITESVSVVQLDADGNAMVSDGNEPDNAAFLNMFAATPQPIDGTAQTGTISWDFNSNGEAFNYLARGEQLVLTYTLTATDAQNATVTQDVTVTITGTNDAPVITVAEADSAAAELTETDGTLTSQGTLSIGDQDRTDAVDIIESVSTAQLDADGNAMASDGNEPDNATLLSMFAAIPQPIDGTAQAGTISWGFNSNGEAFNYLAQGEQLVLTYTLTATDSQNATDTQDVTVTITGTNEVPVISVAEADSVAAELPETDGTLTSSGTLSIGDLDRTDVVDITEAVSTAQLDADGNAMVSDGNEPDNAALLNMFAATPQPIDGSAQAGTITWNFDSNGEAFNYLAQGEQLVLTYTLTATDSHNATDTQDVTVTITGTNDTPVVSNPLAAPENGQTLQPYLYNIPISTFSDIDTTDSISYSVTGLPTGLEFSPETLQISGRPEVSGTFDITVTGTDLQGASTQEVVSLVVDPPAVVVTSSTAPSTVVDIQAGDGSALLSDPAEALFQTMETSDGGEAGSFGENYGEAGQTGSEFSEAGAEGGEGDPGVLESNPENNASDSGSAGSANEGAANGGNGTGAAGQEAREGQSSVTSQATVRVAADGTVQFAGQGDGDVAGALEVESLTIDPETGALELQVRDASGNPVSGYMASLADGSPLPQWLSFDPLTGTVSGTPPEGIAKIELVISTTDGGDESHILELTINFDENTQNVSQTSGNEFVSETDDSKIATRGLQPLSSQIAMIMEHTNDYGQRLMNALG